MVIMVIIHELKSLMMVITSGYSSWWWWMVSTADSFQEDGLEQYPNMVKKRPVYNHGDFMDTEVNGIYI